MTHPDATLGELAATIPAAAQVFYRYGLDYCCGGGQPLARACAAKGLDPQAVLRQIDDAGAPKPGAGVIWAHEPLPRLIEHLLAAYHAPLRAELPRLIELARRVESVHREKPACPRGLAEHLVQMEGDVEAHLAKEEQILFPLILAGRGPQAHMPVQVMLHEHDDHGQALRRTRALTAGLSLPEGACAKWRELYRALGQLEQELMEHIHLENNVLFPRALAA